MHGSSVVILVAIFACALLLGFGMVSSASAHPKTLHEAQHAVDQAWESFHNAAISGTLKSPDIQTQVEQNLHAARALLVKAREADERKDKKAMEELLKQIERLTSRVIAASQERKP